MAKIKNGVIDFSGVESGGGGGGGARVPEADYALVVDKVTEAESKNSGNSMLVWDFKIAKGKYKGKRLKRVYATLTVDSLWKLKSILEALGLPSDKIEIKAILKKAPGKECGGTLVDDEYEGKIKSEIAEFMTSEELDEHSSDDEEDDTDDEDVKSKKTKKKAPKKGKKKKKSDDDDEEIEDLDVDDV